MEFVYDSVSGFLLRYDSVASDVVMYLVAQLWRRFTFNCVLVYFVEDGVKHWRRHTI